MHAAKLLAEAVALARQLGYQIREDDLEGAGGGHCTYGQKKWLLLDVTQSSDEQLRDAVDALRDEPNVWNLVITTPLADRLRPSTFSRAA